MSRKKRIWICADCNEVDNYRLEWDKTVCANCGSPKLVEAESMYSEDVIEAGKALIDLLQWRADELGRRYLEGALEHLRDLLYIKAWERWEMTGIIDARDILRKAQLEIDPPDPPKPGEYSFVLDR